MDNEITQISNDVEGSSPPENSRAAPASLPGTSGSRFAAIAGLTLGFIAGMILLVFAPQVREAALVLAATDARSTRPGPADTSLARKTRQVERRVSDLKSKNGRLTPDRSYLIVNTPDNSFVLMNGVDTLRKGTCSTGSYTLLKAFDNSQQWIFKTPRGMFHVQQKTESPVWRMPDWAFVEDGKAVPADNAPERFEQGVLGDYALSLGDGYLLHGTLYQRFLGMPVTHGCVRLGDDDLKAIYQRLEVGSEVFIY